MKKRSFVPYVVASGTAIVVGLVLGAGKSSNDTSAANTASKFLLTLGVLALLVTIVLEVISRRRAHR